MAEELSHILPHGEKFCFVSEVILGSHPHCIIKLKPELLPKDNTGTVSTYIGIEILAQSAALLRGLQAGDSKIKGYLASIKKFKLSVPRLPTTGIFIANVEFQGEAGIGNSFIGVLVEEQSKKVICSGEFMVVVEVVK